MKKSEKQNGITLIALVITIVILLILAGITIAQLTENGLFNKSSEAKRLQKIAQAQEELKLKIYEATIENNGYLTLQSFAEYLYNDKDNTYVIEVGETAKDDGGIPDLSIAKSMIITYKNLNFEINDKLEIAYVGDATGINISYSFDKDKEYTNENIILTITATSTDGNITGIQETQTDGLSKNQDGTYTISKNGDYEFTVTDSAGNSKKLPLTINKIDKLKPINIELKSENVESTRFIAKTIAEDDEANENNVQSGIEKYEYYIKESTSTEEYTKSESNGAEKEFTGLMPGKEYLMYVRVYDKAGNYEDSDVITVQMKYNWEWTDSDNSATISTADVVTYGTESFYVIGSDDTTVTLLTKYNLNREGTAQKNGNYSTTSCAFSSSNYWKNATSYPYDIVETDIPGSSHYVAYKAYNYGKSLGGIGRLMYYNEANTLKDSIPDIIYGRNIGATDGLLYYWLGSADSSVGIWRVDVSAYGFGTCTYSVASLYGVRPVIIVSKSVVFGTN